MRFPGVRLWLAASSLVALALLAFADDKDAEAAKKIEALRDRLWNGKIEFSVDKSREDSLKQLSTASGIAITIPDDVRKEAAAALAEPVRMVNRGATVRHLLDMILKGSRLFTRLTPDGVVIALLPAPAEAKPGAGPDVVLVATMVESDNIRFGGKTGRSFWLKIDQVARFRKSDPKADEMEFTDLEKRSADLGDTNLLQAMFITKESDDDGLKQLDAFTARFQAGKKFIVAVKSFTGVDTLGELRAHKWGEVRLAEAQVFDFSDETLKKIDEVFK